MGVGMNYQVDSEVHYRAKRAAEGMEISLKKFLERSLLAEAQRWEQENGGGGQTNPYKRKF